MVKLGPVERSSVPLAVLIFEYSTDPYIISYMVFFYIKSLMK